MKERGILMSEPMAVALLRGAKTETRRIVKGAWHEPGGYLQSDPQGEDDGTWYFGCAGVPASFIAHFPYGNIGDILYVKETHWRFGHWVRNGKTKSGRQAWRFQADYPPNLKCSVIFCAGCNEPPDAPPPRGMARPGWWKRPGIFLPKCYARIRLEVTGRGCERVQDITEESALAEGTTWPDRDGQPYRPPIDTTGMSGLRMAAERYFTLFEKINGAGAAANNPFVWVIRFRRVEQ